MLTSQLRLVVIIGLVTLSKVAFSEHDHDHSKHNHDLHSATDGIQQLYKEYFEWKYTVWSPEAGKMKICPVLHFYVTTINQNCFPCIHFQEW